jgi:hypothetical protein
LHRVVAPLSGLHHLALLLHCFCPRQHGGLHRPQLLTCILPVAPSTAALHAPVVLCCRCSNALNPPPALYLLWGQALVEGEMQRVYGQDAVAAVATVHDIRALQPVAATYQSLLQQFGDVLDWYAGQLRRRACSSNSSSSSDEGGREQQQAAGGEAAGRAAQGTASRGGNHGRKKAGDGSGDAAASLPARKVSCPGDIKQCFCGWQCPRMVAGHSQ